MEELISKQIKYEEQFKEEGLLKAKQQLMTAIKRGDGITTPFGMVLLKLGFGVYSAKIKEYFEADLKGHSNKRRNLIKLISNEDTDLLSYAVLSVILNNMLKGFGSMSVTHLATQLIYTLNQTLLYNRLTVDNPKLKAYIGYEFRRANKRRKQYLLEKNIKALKYSEDNTTKKELFQASLHLLELLILSGANIVETFVQVEGGRKCKTINKVRLTKEALSVIESIDTSYLVEKTTPYKPLLCPPKPFKSIKDGGYYVLHSPLIKKMVNTRYNKAVEEADLREVIRIVNKYQETPWRVNTYMMELIGSVYTSNTGAFGIPLSTPRTIEEVCPKPSETLEGEEWGKWNKQRQDWLIKLDSEGGHRLELALGLGTAKWLVEEGNKFWYTYQLDYRGRVYPKESYFNIQKGKAIKAMLEFGEGAYLTPDGVRWLKIHIANMYGLDKQPYEERVQWTDDNYNQLMQIASNPMEHRAFIELADSPLEFIAACKAYEQHLMGEKVHLPIQLDATCSGIQMYSGLLRDEEGARSVNVIGQHREDIYQRVADMSELLLEQNDYDPIVSFKDSEGVVRSVLATKAANELKSNITRKLVKQPTMTVPYSVTYIGMSDQIYTQLKDLQDKGKAFWTEETWVVNRVLTQLISKAIYLVVDGARKGQDYLVSLGGSLKESALWYTPLYNFPVYQNVLEPMSQRLTTPFGSLTVKLGTYKFNKRRQRQRIAPNFIHSIDSTVLLGVIDRQTSLLGTVHDCFLVPPNAGYEVQTNYKEAFIEVMEAGPLRLIQQQLDPLETIEFPEYGTLDLEEVRQSEYIIS